MSEINISYFKSIIDQDRAAVVICNLNHEIIRIGQVSKVNAGEMTARVQIPDQGIVTGDLRIVKRPPTVECETGCKIKVKPWIPTVGQWVLCIFKPDGEGDGFVIGGI